MLEFSIILMILIITIINLSDNMNHVMNSLVLQSWIISTFLKVLPNLFKVKQSLHKKWSFPLKSSSVNVTKSPFTADLVTFTEDIFNGKLHFLCSVFRTNTPFLYPLKMPANQRFSNGLRGYRSDVKSVNNTYFLKINQNKIV